MSVDEQVQVQNGPPAWIEEVDLEALAEQLNELLQTRLEERLSGALGAEMAAGMQVSQIDSYHLEKGEPPGEELNQINEELNAELRRILREDYGAPEEDVEYAVVRWWSILAGPKNPRCQWERCWDSNKQTWCWWWDCCPCTDTN